MLTGLVVRVVAVAPPVEKLANSHQPLSRKPKKMEEVEMAGAAQSEREAPAARAGAKSDAKALAEHATRTATVLQRSATELQRSATETQPSCSPIAPGGDLSDAKLLDTGSWHAALSQDASSRARTNGSSASAFAAPAAGLFYSSPLC
jgi:hypothetical protein